MDPNTVRSSLKYPPSVGLPEIFAEAAVVLAVAGVIVLLFG